MALDKLAHSVLPYRLSPDLFCKILDNMTGRRHSPIGKVIDSINKNFFLLNGETLVPEGVGQLSGLSEASDASRDSGMRAFVVPSCLGAINELSSAKCLHCGRNPS
jgi:hypothetical protein